MEFKLTIDFSPAAQQILTALIGGLGAGTPAAAKQPATVKQLPASNTDGKTEPLAPVTTAANGETLTVEGLRAIVQSKTQGNKLNGVKVKAILAGLGTDSLTNLDAVHYPAFKTAIEAL